jgi:sucrose-phosphate synthase
MKGIVVSNYSPELEDLKKNRSVYFAKSSHASGVLEGVRYYTKDNVALVKDVMLHE